MKKVLLVNVKREKCGSPSPHLGLAMLAGVLKKANHNVLVVDYQFNRKAPHISHFVNDFNPDVIGVSLYTASMKEAESVIDYASKFEVPLIIGGPHATLYYEEMSSDKRIDYIITGEAEEVITQLVENARCEEKPKLIYSIGSDPKLLPNPDFTAFFGYKDIPIYPLLTSRGCPYNCSFCAVHKISSRKWRPREPETCINELVKAKEILTNLSSVIIYDDAPMVVPSHIENILRLYIDKKILLPLLIINTRADFINEKILGLVKQAGVVSIALGAEHGHPDVFNQIGKGETLEDIKAAAKAIKKYNIPLYLCFIIGLPGDSLEKTKYSINLVKELKADFVYWNMVTPYKGTKLKSWYESHGKIFDVINLSSYIDDDFTCEEPCVETPEFNKFDRKKAYYMAILETNDRRISLAKLPKLISIIREYMLYRSLLIFIYLRIKNIPKDIFEKYSLKFLRAKQIYQESGHKGLIKRILKTYNYN